jgi:hypothetical protein
MIRRPARRRGLDPVEPQIGQIKRINERVDHANRVAFVDPVFEAFWQQRSLRAFRPRYESPHQFPRRFISRIIAWVGFSHSQGQLQEWKKRSERVSSTPDSGRSHCAAANSPFVPSADLPQGQKCRQLDDQLGIAREAAIDASWQET